MICDMKRAAGVVTLLGLGFSTAVRPALAQDGASNSWFDGASADAPPPPESAPQAPESNAPDPGSEEGPSGPPPTEAPQQEPQPGPQPGSADEAPETDPRAITEFRPTLDPYGNWLDDPKYGTVWVPNRDAVGDDFAPYVSAGHWALTDDNDWTWQSDYPFGGVVFHYGRWVWIPGTGWAWVAGQRYANAWVTWRVPTDDYGYVGWAPMPPAWGWYGGSAVSLWWYPPAAYVFCPSGYAFSPHVHSYIVHDRDVIHDVAAHTRNYSGGGRGGVQHLAASPRVLPANSAAPRGPSLQTAHVPASMAPMSRVPMRSAFAGARAVPSYRSTNGIARPQSAYQGGRSWSPSSAGYRSPTYSSPSATSYRAAPRVWSAASAPRYYSAPSAPARSESAFHYPAAVHDSAPARYAAPVRYSTPAVHYSAPAVHYSAPVFHSAPAFHFAPSSSFHSPSRR